MYYRSGLCAGRAHEKLGGTTSKQAAQACVEKFKSDEAFRAKVMAEEDVEARMALIGAEGFDCSATGIGALRELGEAELDGVAGGSWCPDVGQRCNRILGQHV